jgi:hypothetical protein
MCKSALLCLSHRTLHLTILHLPQILHHSYNNCQYMPSSKKIIYHCDCEQYCKGKLKVLGRKAYFAHAMYRKRDTQSNPSQSSGGPRSGTTEGATDPPGGPQSGCAHHSSGELSTPSGMPARGDILDSEGGHAPLSGDDSLSFRADDLGNMQPAFPETLYDSDPGFHLPTPPQFPPGSHNDLEFLQGPIQCLPKPFSPT